MVTNRSWRGFMLSRSRPAALCRAAGIFQGELVIFDHHAGIALVARKAVEIFATQGRQLEFRERSRPVTEPMVDAKGSKFPGGQRHGLTQQQLCSYGYAPRADHAPQRAASTASARWDKTNIILATAVGLAI